MKQYIAAIAALAIALTPAFGTAMERGPRGGSGGGRAAPSRQAPSRQSASRPSGGGQARPASRPAPQAARPSSGGFNLKGDTKPMQRPASAGGASRPSGSTGN